MLNLEYAVFLIDLNNSVTEKKKHTRLQLIPKKANPLKKKNKIIRDILEYYLKKIVEDSFQDIPNEEANDDIKKAILYFNGKNKNDKKKIIDSIKNQYKQLL